MGKGLRLYVLEGGHPDGFVSDCITGNFMTVPVPVKCVYGTSMYKLYKELASEPALDIVEVLRASCAENAMILDGLTKHDFDSVYLFFDYDGHNTNADDAIVRDMLTFFNDEMEYGKMFVSYPMVEALRHYPDRDAFMRLVVKGKPGGCGRHRVCVDFNSCKQEKHYKKVVPAECRADLVNWGKYGLDEWKLLVRDHVMKGNLLVEGGDSWPEDVIGQLDIFDVQERDYLSMACPRVSVLSGFPLFLLDYLGSSSLWDKVRP